MKKLDEIDYTFDDGGGNQQLLDQRINLVKSLADMERIDNMDFAQKIKIKWGVEGDENTDFFHSMLKRKRRKLAVSGVMVDGSWLAAPEHVKKSFLDFFL